MAQIRTTVVERPGRASPAALANTIAILSWYPGMSAITYAQRLGDVSALGLWGKGSDLGAFALRDADERANPATIYFVPTEPSIVGTITDNGATGFGPTQVMETAVPGHAHPYDDAIVKVRIRDAGIPGVATFELSTAYLVTRDVNGGNPTIVPLYLPAQNVPEETSACLTGTKNITSIVYAKPAIVTGSIDIVSSSSLYGSSGTLAGKEFDIDPDGVGAVTVAFGTGIDAPSSYIDALDAINNELAGAAIASVTNEGKLRLTGVEVSSAGSIVFTAGSPDALALLGLTASTKAKVVGNVNMLTFNYDTGTALDGLTVIVDENTTTAQTVTLGSLVGTYTSLLSALNTGTTNITWTLDGSGFLVAECDTAGIASTIVLGAGTAHTAVFGTPTTTSPGTGPTTVGTAGALDGLTVIYIGDATSGSQTWTLPSAGSAIQNYTSLTAIAEALTGVAASAYSSASFLRIGSETSGEDSTFSITGGTGLTALGLSIASAIGSASVYVIEHLGVKITFPQGTYSTNYERTWTVKAPSHSITDVQTAITTMVAAGVKVGRIVCPGYVPIGQVAAFIQGAASKIGILESANDAQFAHFAFGAPVDESDSGVRAAYVSGVAGDKNVGRRVDLATRIEYVRPARSSPNNTGSLIRSPLWSLVGRYASLPLGSDVGQHNVGPLPYVDHAPVDEDAATVKHSALRIDTADPRAMTLQQWADGLYFTAGFTLAPSASAYADQYVRDITLRVAQLIHAAMRPFLNDPTLATDPATGRLTNEGAGTISAAGMSALVSLLPPENASESARTTALLSTARVIANQTNVIAGLSGTQQLLVDVYFTTNGIARDIRITVGAGTLEVNETQG
jgi:hypothetical protein